MPVSMVKQVAALPGPVLVTGGNGMLGRALCERLAAAGEPPALVPSRSTLDFDDRVAVAEFIDTHRPQSVFHLAGFVRGIAGNLEAGVEALRANARIQFNLFDSLLVHPPDVVVVAGTVAAYAYPYVELPLCESDFWSGSPHGSEGFYAAGKRVAIPFMEALAQMGVGTRFAILTNLFGAHDHFGDKGAHVVPSLVARFADASHDGSSEVSVWGSPTVTRDFLWSKDAAQHLIDLAMESAVSRGYLPVNVASGRETTMSDLVDEVVKVSGFAGRVNWDATAPIGVPRRAMSVEVLRHLSKHQPHDLSYGIEETVRSYVRQTWKGGAVP